MLILGLQKTTLLDYPQKLAATIFTGGCNLKCPFCHNKDLVFPPSDSISIPEDEVISFLEKRKNILEAVCITGGEPTLQKDIVDFISKIKSLGYLVKLDSNGFNPEILKSLLDKKLLDYIAIDIKNTREKYNSTTGTICDMEKFDTTLSILKNCDIPYEFRTTIVKEFHTEEDLIEISEWISFAPAYFLQSFEDSGNIIQDGLHAHSEDTLLSFLEICRKKIPNTQLRGL